MSHEPSLTEQKIRLVFANFGASLYVSYEELESCKIDDLHHDARLMGKWSGRMDRSPEMRSIVGFRWTRIPYLADPLRFIDVPMNWWEHLKQRWFPPWAIKRWPVKMNTYEARAYADPTKLGDYAAPGGLVEWYSVTKQEDEDGDD